MSIVTTGRTLMEQIYHYSELSVFPTKRIHDGWLIHYNYHEVTGGRNQTDTGALWPPPPEGLSLRVEIIDRRGKLSCCRITPYCSWCLLDFVCRRRLRRFVHRWRQFRKNMIKKIWNRQLTGKW